MGTTGAEGDRASARRFCLVVAVRDAEQDLPAFIGSVDAQTFDASRTEVVVVDEGSTDRTAAVVEGWRDRRPDVVTLVREHTEGTAAARNRGLREARAEWVTFPDPRDVLSADYLAEVDRFLRRRSQAELLCARPVQAAPDNGRTPPADARFGAKNRLRDLGAEPEYVVDDVRSTFFRLDRLRERALDFDETIGRRPAEILLCSRYLLAATSPEVGFVSTARYDRAAHGDGDVLAGEVAVLLEKAYLPLLEEATARPGRAPGWLQSTVLDGLARLLRNEDAGGDSLGVSVDEADVIHDLMARITACLAPDVVETFAMRRFPAAWRDVLQHGYARERWTAPHGVATRLDTRQHLVQVRYRFAGDPPREAFVVGGRPAQPVFAKTRAVVYFHRTVLHERIVWLPAGTLRMWLDDRTTPVLAAEPAPGRASLSLAAVRRRLDPGRTDADVRRRREPGALRDAATLRLARTRLVRRLFRDAWVLIDRVTDADDSAEVLFRWVRRHRRGTNAWFVVDRAAPDFRRLRRDGHRRVVAFGSLAHRLLMLNADHLISSHIIDLGFMARLTSPTWQVTFLNHGVIKDDLSNWLNPKNLDVFVTSTQAEYASVADDDTAYQYGDRETVLSGMPRFDQLLEAARAVPEEERRLLLLAPTWRQWLVDTSVPGRLHVDPERFLASEFAERWLGLLRSPELAALAEQHGLQVALLLHPNLQVVREHLDLPGHVRALSFEGGQVRSLFARTRLLVTDYSSMSFNAAYLDRPVVYFQFDRDQVLHGAHLGRRGYFDYERDGYGPVATTVAGAVEAVTSTIRAGAGAQEPYATRVLDAFPHRDGRCSERTFEAIERAGRRKHRPASADEAPASS